MKLNITTSKMCFDLFEAQNISYIGCDNRCALIDYSSEAVDMFVESECIIKIKDWRLKRLNPDKILIVIK